MSMKRYLFTAEVLLAEGSQTFRVDANSLEEAQQILSNGGGDIYVHEVEVVSLGEFELERETTLDDFGDFPEGDAA